MRMDEMVTYLERRGFKAVKSYSAKEHAYEFTIERNGLKLTDGFEYRGDGKTIWKAQEDFLDKLIENFERIEKIEEREKNKMKNIAFDISRDGPVGKLVIKDNVYDVEVKKVGDYCAPNEHQTTLTLNVINPRTKYDPYKYARQCYTDGTERIANVTYNPDRKDSINEGKVQIKDVIFNPPATIVFWSDGSKTVVKAENEVYDPEKGLAMAIAKRALGNQGNYFETFKKYTEKYCNDIIAEEKHREKVVAEGKKRYEEATKASKSKPYHIWYEDENGDIKTFAARTYVREANARKAGCKIFAGTTTRWIVTKKNPFTKDDWNKIFGSDS